MIPLAVPLEFEKNRWNFRSKGTSKRALKREKTHWHGFAGFLAVSFKIPAILTRNKLDTNWKL